jgi:hypothetical protein
VLGEGRALRAKDQERERRAVRVREVKGC